jgi:thioredoxin-related protein
MMTVKFRFYTALRVLLFAAVCATQLPAHAATASAEIEVPAWFKVSFLDLRDDLKEATAGRKRLVLYFGQNGCPYCKRLMEVNWRQPDIVAKTRRHFDVIEMNIFGSREVNWIDGRPRSEKELAALLKVQFTPTLLFLDERGEIALRVNGYYPPPRFSAALDYVAGHRERQESFADYLARTTPATAAAGPRDERLFRPAPFVLDRRKPAPRPLAVFFEGPGCTACDEMHATALKAGATRELLARYDAYRLDLTSAVPVVSPAGNRTTVAAWGRELKVSYTPSIVLFDPAGHEVFRVEAYVRTFHLQSALDYVASRAYQQEPNFQRYLQARADARRDRGEQVDVMD